MFIKYKFQYFLRLFERRIKNLIKLSNNLYTILLKSLKNFWWIFSFLFLLILALLVIHKPSHGDERHIIDTIRLFNNNLNLETIKNYPEVTPPFFFIFYALWAKLFGQSIESLRILTLIVSFITWQLLFVLFNKFTKNEKHSILLSLLIIANPYFFGTSIFVFTDMPTILFILAALLSFFNDRFLLYILFTSFAILCRQYAIIIPTAIIIYSFSHYRAKNYLSIKYITSSLISCLPLIILIILWNGIAPRIGIEKWIVNNSSVYNIDYINTYISFSVIYTLPLIVYYFSKIKFNRFSFIIALIIFFYLSLFPIKPSMAAIIQTDYRTVGYAHRFLSSAVGLDSIFMKTILSLLLLIGTYLSVELFRKFIRSFSKETKDKSNILILLWFLFLFIMPFSYQVWEKYLIMILPFLALSIYNLINQNPDQ